jgi:hypothetical protein
VDSLTPIEAVMALTHAVLYVGDMLATEDDIS